MNQKKRKSVEQVGYWGMTILAGLIVTISGHYIIENLDKDPSIRMDGVYIGKRPADQFQYLRFYDNGEVYSIFGGQNDNERILLLSKDYVKVNFGNYSITEGEISFSLNSYTNSLRWLRTDEGKEYEDKLNNIDTNSLLYRTRKWSKKYREEYNGTVEDGELKLTVGALIGGDFSTSFKFREIESYDK